MYHSLSHCYKYFNFLKKTIIFLVEEEVMTNEIAINLQFFSHNNKTELKKRNSIM